MRNTTIKSSVLIALVALYFTLVLNVTFWSYVHSHVSVNSLRAVLFVATLPFFIFAIVHVLINLLMFPYFGKFAVSLLLATSAVASYMMYQYGAYIDADMMQNVFETNQREALDLMTPSALLWTLLFGVAPSAALCLARVEYAPPGSEIKRRLCMVALSFAIVSLIAALSYKEYASFGRNNSQVQKLIVPTNTLYATMRYFQLRALSGRELQHLDPQAKYMPFADPALTVLVLIVGETARAQNFALGGYERNTNPILGKERDVVYFNHVTACGTATAVSVPCMFSNLRRKSFDAVQARFTENILDMAKENGYDVLWRENDDGCKGVCDRVANESMKKKKNSDKYCDGESCYDEALLDGLEDYLKNIKQNTLVVLHTIGSHGPTYYKRYPERFKVFRPTCDTAEIQDCTRDEIINTYDNTIVYTDYVVSRTLGILKKFPGYESGLIYVSDHGESLGEKNIYLHGIPYAIAPKEQTNIPMILWMSENMKRYDHIDYECVKNEAGTKTYSHDNLFHSILGILEINTKVYEPEYDIFRACRLKELPSRPEVS